MCGIYKITNLVNQTSYIGQSIDIEARWKQHKWDAFNPKDPGYEYPLYRAIRKYGIESFSFDVLEECSLFELNEKEIYYIAFYDTYYNGYNQDKGGQNASHYIKLSEELVLQIIATLKTSKESSDSIGEKFGVCGSMIRRINNGKSCCVDGMSYPIRKRVVVLPQHNQRKPSELKNSNNSDAICTCEKCGAPIPSKRAKLCVKCAHDAQRRVERPKPLELAQMVKENGFTEVGNQFGVDGNTIKKWCKQYHIPHKLNDLINWYNKQIGIEDRVDPSSEHLSKTPVEQIDPKTGKVIATFESATAAARAFGRKKGAKISDACNGRAKSTYSYLWRFASPQSISNPTTKP